VREEEKETTIDIKDFSHYNRQNTVQYQKKKKRIMSSSTNGMILFVACILLTNSFKLRSPSIAKRIPLCCTNGYKEKAAVAKSVLIELQLPFKENEEILRIKNDIILTKAIDGKVILIVTNTVAHFFRIRELY
jgi:hypothetical protein